MTWVLIAMSVLAWWTVGFSILAYECTRELDLDVGDAIVAAFFGFFLGPLALVVTFILWMDETPLFRRVIIKGRRK